MKNLLALLLLGSLPLLPAHASKKAAPPPPPPSLQDFAWQQDLGVSGQEAAYRLELPAAVYSGSRRADLGDVRIFNGNGELLPYAFLPPPPVPEQAPTRLRLAHFPIHASSTSTNGIHLDLQADKNGQLKSLRVNAVADNNAADTISSYILDASTLKQIISGLKLVWSAPSGANVVALNVEASDNLQDWHMLRTNAPLIDLRLGSEQLQRDRIELNSTRAKYLRLSWSSPQHAIVLNQVEAEISAETQPRPTLQWTAVSVQAGAVAGEYLFDSSGLPVASLRLGLPQTNTVAPYRLFHRANAQTPWRETSSNIAYRLTREGQEITPPDVALTPSRDRYWRLVVDQRGGGLGSGLPTITLGWLPQQLLFIARGAAPFKLAYGNREISPAEYSASILLPGFRPEQGQSLPVAQVAPLAPATEPPAVSAMTDPVMRNKLILWSVLLLGVAALGVMVWRLLRQMK